MSQCTNNTYVFQEAYNHTRRKTLLRSTVEEINLASFQGKSFEEVLGSVVSLCKSKEGLGKLAMYDIASAICRYNTIPIKRTYIIGAGPKRAVKLLGLQLQKQKIGPMTFEYVDIPEIKESFQKKGFALKPSLELSKDGDAFETYLCQWQKTQD